MRKSRKNGHVAADILMAIIIFMYGLSVITTNNSTVIVSVTFRDSTYNWNFNDRTAVSYRAAAPQFESCIQKLFCVVYTSRMILILLGNNEEIYK